MQISKYFKPEALMFAAFLATLPIYSPNQLLFETELLQRAAYMPGLCQYASGRFRGAWRRGGYRLGAWALGRDPAWGCRAGRIGGLRCGLCAVRFGCRARELCPADFWRNGGASACRLYGGALSCLGAYLAQFNLRQALLWLAVMVGVAALVELLLSSVTFAVGLIVFAVLVPLSCLVPCWLAWRGRLIAVREAGEAESRSAPTLGAMAQLRQMAQVVAMPFVGLMVFAFMMGARKFVLFDVVHMEVLGCVLGAVVVLPICLMRTRVPLMPHHLSGAGAPVRAAADLPELFSRVDRPHVVRRLDELCVLRRRGHLALAGLVAGPLTPRSSLRASSLARRWPGFRAAPCSA